MPGSRPYVVMGFNSLPKVIRDAINNKVGLTRFNEMTAPPKCSHTVSWTARYHYRQMHNIQTY